MTYTRLLIFIAERDPFMRNVLTRMLQEHFALLAASSEARDRALTTSWVEKGHDGYDIV